MSAPPTCSLQEIWLDGAQAVVLQVQHEHLGAIEGGWKTKQRYILAEDKPQVGQRLGATAQRVEHAGWVGGCADQHQQAGSELHQCQQSLHTFTARNVTQFIIADKYIIYRG